MKVIENEWIPLSDGSRLAAKIWLPEEAFKQPVPAILEYIPYRKRDQKAARDHAMFSNYAKYGYAGIRVDLRGSGDSEGVLQDEYLEQELEDGLEVLRWISSQPWCNGSIAMQGLSWGGFNSLQIAALAPPELKTIITVCSSDDRYADDIHYMGGCLLTDNLSWASTMFSFNSCPPDPAIHGEDWRKLWRQRLEANQPWIIKWLKHQRRDQFWKHASVCEDYSRIQIPVLAVSGWADGYSDAVFRLVENLDDNAWGLVGPWNHAYPHSEGVGPAIDFIGEALRWYDCWLKGKDNGTAQAPRLRVWMQEPASPLLVERKGRWVAEEAWPSRERKHRNYYLSPLQLTEEIPTEGARSQLSIQSPLSVGLFAGKWYSYSAETDLPWDQREEDGGALIFETHELKEAFEILGAPLVKLRLSTNRPQAMVAARLSIIDPEDYATRVTYGILNLSHRKSHEGPEPMPINELEEVSIRMNKIAQRFPAGYRLRLSLSSSYWPLAWPAPESPRLRFDLNSCQFQLPIRTSNALDSRLTPFESPRAVDTLERQLLVPAQREWTVAHNLATNHVSLNIKNNDPKYYYPHIDLETERKAEECYSYFRNDYRTLRGEVKGSRSFHRRDWKIETITHTVLTSDKTQFRIVSTLDAYENEMRCFSQSWDELIKRDYL